jgi:hypothetical protein
MKKLQKNPEKEKKTNKAKNETIMSKKFSHKSMIIKEVTSDRFNKIKISTDEKNYYSH